VSSTCAFKPQLVKHYSKELSKKRPDVDRVYKVLLKYDGQFGTVGDDEVIRSRIGTEKVALARWKKVLNWHRPGRIIFEIMPRVKASWHVRNGMMNAKKVLPVDCDFILHDIIVDKEEPFEIRWERCLELVRKNRYLTLAKSFGDLNLAGSHEKLMKIFNQLEETDEGLVAKALTSTYEEGKRNQMMMKLKKNKVLKGVIVKVNEGEGKFAGTTGSVTVKLNSGGTVNVSGMTDAKRDMYWARSPVGEEIAVGCMEVLESGSLREPVLL